MGSKSAQTARLVCRLTNNFALRRRLTIIAGPDKESPARQATLARRVCDACNRRHHEQVSSTPLWVPLVVAGIGVAGTLTAGIAGALVTWRLSNQREEKVWAREREREREQRAREDEARRSALSSRSP
jgi:hypothetical protein